MVNFRERLVCEYCKLNSRQRFTASFLKRISGDSGQEATIYCYEQVTNFFRYVKECLQTKQRTVIGSEYLGYHRTPGEVVQQIRHEDALKLSFENETLDIVVANDVFEHVPDIDRAIQEAFRVLKKEGRVIFTVPFYSLLNENVQRAYLSKGEPVYLMPEVYHGNPVSKQGSLVFYDYGWDVLKSFKQQGFKDVYALLYYSCFYGYLGNFPMLFVAEK